MKNKIGMNIYRVIAIISALAFYFIFPFSQVSATPITGCPSSVMYEDASGNIYCIAQAQDGVDNAYPGTAAGNWEFSPNHGYLSQNLIPHLTNQNDTTHGSCDIEPFGYTTSPIIGYKTAIENGPNCTDSDFPGANKCNSTNDPTTSTPYGNNRLNPTDACIYMRYWYIGKSYDGYICNQDVTKICDNVGYLRAEFADDPSGSQSTGLYLFCDQQEQGKNQKVIDPILMDGINNPGKEYIPPVSYCCTDNSSANLDLSNGLNIKTTATDKTRLATTSAVNKRGGFNNTCDITGMATTVGQVAPSGVVTCANTDYYNSHLNECHCTFDAGTGVANGNTYTALGCIPSNFGSVINIFLSVAIAIAGVIALIMMFIGGYEIMTNPAGPDEIKEGQQYIVNAILGLLLIIFCVIILRIIGVDILGIQEIGKLLG